MTLRPGLGRKRIASVIVTCASVKGAAMRPPSPKVRSVLADNLAHAGDALAVPGDLDRR
jgi:hypothetical protein